VGPFDDILWFDPIDIFNGRLSSLALDGGSSKLRALGVIAFTYLRLKLNLIRDGYDAEFHPYDWRQSIESAARALLQRVAREKGTVVNLVGHSLGGLVARAALGIGRREGHPAFSKIRRVVMLATPNFGSFASVQVLRGTYDTVRKVAWLDRKHNASWLAANVFNTFPGIYEMLPAPGKSGPVDLYRSDSWPATGPGPRQPLLDRVAAARELLAPASDRLFLIAGVNLNTTVGVRSGNGEFLYEVSKEGDGTVPLELALLPGVRTYYIEETHGSLPNHPRIAIAVAGILDHGETDALPDRWERTRAPVRLVRESELRVSPFEEARPLSPFEERHLIEEFASPDYHQERGAKNEERGATLAAPLPGRRHRIDLRLALGSITEVNARAYVLGLFEDVTPGGAARALDQRLGGIIGELSLRRMFSSGVGEIFMMPASRSGLPTEVIAFVGLGSFDRFTEEVQQLAAENVIRTFVRINVEECAAVLIGAGSGAGVERSLRALLQGVARALIDADTDHRFRRVILCERDPEVFEQIREALSRLAQTDLLAELEITLDEVILPTPPAVAPARGAAVLGEPEPVYLIVRTEQEDPRSTVLRSSVLTAGPKAAVVSGTMPFSDRNLAVALAPISNNTFHRDSLRAIGNALSTLLLDEPVRTVLSTMRQRHLVVVHDAPSSRVPWEVLCIDDWFPAAEAGLSHRYTAENLSVAKWLEQRRDDGTLEILLVVDPTEDLEGARGEGDRLRSLFAGETSVRIDEYRGRDATKPALLSAFRSGKYDVVHYAGHAFFDAPAAAQNGLLCHGGAVLSGADLAGLGNLPALVFFNACESARVRRPPGQTRGRGDTETRKGRVPASPRPPVPASGWAVGVAEAFLRGGLANYLGTYWPVGDAAAEKFAGLFYERLLGGSTIGAALQAGRSAVQALGRQQGRDWPDYLHYGDPRFVLKTGA
jgi:pimeloyl-ACP methyl ester carboxylesterase